MRDDGHDVVYIQEIATGAEDQTVLQMAADQERILLTEDKDFGELVVRLQLPAYGIVLLRMNPADSDSKVKRLREVLKTNDATLAGFFTVVEEARTRRRALRAAGNAP